MNLHVKCALKWKRRERESKRSVVEKIKHGGNATIKLQKKIRTVNRFWH